MYVFTWSRGFNIFNVLSFFLCVCLCDVFTIFCLTFFQRVWIWVWDPYCSELKTRRSLVLPPCLGRKCSKMKNHPNPLLPLIYRVAHLLSNLFRLHRSSKVIITEGAAPTHWRVLVTYILNSQSRLNISLAISHYRKGFFFNFVLIYILSSIYFV